MRAEPQSHRSDLQADESCLSRKSQRLKNLTQLQRCVGRSLAKLTLISENPNSIFWAEPEKSNVESRISSHLPLSSNGFLDSELVRTNVFED